MAKRFKPSLPATIIVVLMLIILLSLGTWQINRSEEKQLLLDSFAHAPTLPDLELNALGADWEQYRYRKIELAGKYDTRYQVLLENQIRHGKSGYMVMTPYHLSGEHGVVLVNRGWIEKSQSALSDIEVSEELRSVSGLINHPPSVGMRIGSLDDAASGWPKALPYVDLEWLALQMGTQLTPWIVLLDVEEPDGFERDWHPSVRMTPEKHQGYAMQWYSLAVALVFLFVVGSLKPEGNDDRKNMNSGDQA
jgi:surfeit locus 1 family protein